MRILHVLNAAGGGASVGAYELIRASAAARSDLRHAVVHPGRLGDPPSPHAALAERSRQIPMRWWNVDDKLPFVNRVALALRDAQTTRLGAVTRRELRAIVKAWEIDLIHTNTAATLDGALVAREMGIPHVWHVRERIGSDGFMKFPLSDRKLAERIASLANVVVPMSRFVDEFFQREGQGDRTRVVHDSVSVPSYASADASARGKDLRRAWGVPDDVILVGKVAAVTSLVKGHDVFVRAAARLARMHPRVRFVIVGALPKPARWPRTSAWAHMLALRDLARREGIEGKLVFAGHVDDAPAAMNAIDVLAHACDIEGFGRVAIEAMAAARPVVGPDAGGFRESVVPGVTGELVAPRDHSALADALLTLVEDPKAREAQGIAGRARVLRAFSPAKHLQEMSSIYETAAKRGRA